MYTYRLILFLIFLWSFSHGQIEPANEFFPDEHLENFDLKGNVKSVEIRETVDGFDSKGKMTYITNLHFNENGFLFKTYLTNVDGFKYLDEENVYNNNLLVRKTLYSRKREEVDGKLVFTAELLPYQIKYTYDLEGKLLAKHEKSHLDGDFFLTEKYKYSNNLLVEELVLNKHFGRNRMEWVSGNYLIKNSYNTNNQLINKKKYNYEARGRNKHLVDSVEHFEVIIHEEHTIDSTKFVLVSEWNYKYNKLNQLIFSEVIDHSANKEIYTINTSYEYFGSKPSKVVRLFNAHNITVDSTTYHILNKTIDEYDYQIVKNDTLISTEMSLYQHEASDDIEVHTKYKYEYNSDGTYLKVWNKDNKTGSINKYNKYGNLVELINTEGLPTEKITYHFDAKGNWVYKQHVILPEIKEIELVERKIEYYD